MQSIDDKLLNRVYGAGRGNVVTQDRFLDLGSRAAVDQALSRLAKKGTLRRLARGLYDYPKIHPDLGLLSPDPDRLARAVAGKFATRLQPSGAYAANLLGLSTQVPAKIIYLTDGPSKLVRVGNQKIHLKQRSTKDMKTAGRISGLVIQALRYLGKQHIDQPMIDHLRRTMKGSDKKQLLQDIKYAPAWIADHIRAITRES